MGSGETVIPNMIGTTYPLVIPDLIRDPRVAVAPMLNKPAIPRILFSVPLPPGA